MNINAFDLNLLRVFHAVLEEGNLTAAGARLGLSQSAMSHAVNRLRLAFKDPLFVRTTRGMKPTAYALTLAGPMAQAIGAIKQTLELDMPFDPMTTDRVFNLLMTDIAELIFLPRLIPYLKQVAPGARIVSTQMERALYRDALEQGQADLAIGQLPQLHTDFYQQHLFAEPLGCMLRKAHPTIGETIDMAQFMDAEHIVVSAPALVEYTINRALGKHSVKRKIALQTPHYTAVSNTLAETDLIAVVPMRASVLFGDHQKLKMLGLPFKAPALRVTQFWHQRSHHDRGHVWLRGVLAALFRGKV